MDHVRANPFDREIEELHDAYMSAVDRVFRSGWYILGKEVESFERELASYLGVAQGVGCASGLDALMLSLKALGVGPGDEVITTPLSAAATALAISHLGARPIFADVEASTLSLDPPQVAKCITARTKAVIPVHLYGYPARILELEELCRKRALHLIEDCAQSIGAHVNGRMTGTFGITGCFSFYPTKNLGAFGDAGFIATNDCALADQLRMLRNYGQRARYEHVLDGFNSRLDELHAAVLREKLKHLETWTERRTQIARKYDSSLNRCWRLPAPPAGGRCVYHLYPIQLDDRDSKVAMLKGKGVEALIHYPTLIPEQECYRHALQKGAKDSWPVAYSASRRLLSLPINPYLRESEIETSARTLEDE